MSNFDIEVKGIDKLLANLESLEGDIIRYLGEAGREAGKHIISQKGLRNYPAATEANQPPTPYYKRGVGMQYNNSNNGKSERYGTKFYVKQQGYETHIGNSASYARYLTDEKKQARRMATIGWRKMIDVAMDQSVKIKQIFQGWIDKLIKDNNL